MTYSFALTAEQTEQGLEFLRLRLAQDAPEAPVVLVLHGLGRSKEHLLPTLYAFAQAGYQAVGLDARLHGGRDGAAERDARMQSQSAPTLYEMITGTARDIPLLLDALGATRAAVHGVSLGGYITFAALLAEPRLQVATVAMGSPDWLEGLRTLGIGPGHPMYDISAQGNPLDLAAKHYPPRPLLMLHGDEDEVVNINGVRVLHERLRPVYEPHPERLNLTIFPGLGHRYIDEMVALSVAWTQRFLPPE